MRIPWLLLLCVATITIHAQDAPAPATDPPETDPPETDPPETDPPETDPPVTDPPVTDPPVTDPPVTDPPPTPPPRSTPAPPSRTPAPSSRTPAPSSSSTPSPKNTATPAPFDGAKSSSGTEGWKIAAIAGGLGAVLILIVIALCCCRRRHDFDADSPLPAYVSSNDPKLQQTVAIPSTTYSSENNTRSNSTDLGGYQRPPPSTQRRPTSPRNPGVILTTYKNPSPPVSNASSTNDLSVYDGFPKPNLPRVDSDVRSSSWGSSNLETASEFSIQSSHDRLDADAADARSQWLSAIATGELDAGEDSRESAKQKLDPKWFDTSPSDGRSTYQFNDVDRGSYEL